MYQDVSTLDYLKIMEARNLIETTDLPIESIALKLGFPTLADFERIFRRLERRKPLTVRNGNRSKGR